MLVNTCSRRLQQTSFFRFIVVGALRVNLDLWSTVQYTCSLDRAFSSNFGKRPMAKIGKNDHLTAKLGETNDIQHNKGSKVYPQNQVISDFIMPTIPLVFKYHSDMGHVSHK